MVTPEARLADYVDALSAVGIDVLVMGGHAVRHYGLRRETDDFDLCTATITPLALRDRLTGTDLLRSAVHAPAWRGDDFTRFQVGTLPDGRPEWLEFWIKNHLMDAFPDLWARREVGSYAGRQVPFLSLADLMRSKETVRPKDWRDISTLEEINDERNVAAVRRGASATVALAELRSRRGFRWAIDAGLFDDPAAVRSAATTCRHPVTYAFLAPLVPDVSAPPTLRAAIDPAFLAPIRRAGFGSSIHLNASEIVRRAYVRQMADADAADKQAHLPPPP